MLVQIILLEGRVAAIAGVQRVYHAGHDEDKRYHHGEGKYVVYRAYLGALLIVLDAAAQYGIGKIDKHAHSGAQLLGIVAPCLTPGKLCPLHARKHAQYAEADACIGKLQGIDIVFKTARG